MLGNLLLNPLSPPPAVPPPHRTRPARWAERGAPTCSLLQRPPLPMQVGCVPRGPEAASVRSDSVPCHPRETLCPSLQGTLSPCH